MTARSISSNLTEAGASPSFQMKSKHTLRLAFYVQLLGLDIVTFLLGPCIAWMILGDDKFKIEDFYFSVALLCAYLVLAMIRGTYSLTSLQRYIGAVRLAMSSFVLAISLMCVLDFLIDHGTRLSRLEFLVSTTVNIVLIVSGRLAFIAFARRMSGGAFLNELVILDGRERRHSGDHARILDAAAAGLRPDLHDPKMLALFGHVVSTYDRVVIDSAPERRRAWALLLKGANIDGEILLDEANDVGAIGMRTFQGMDSLLVSRKPLSMPNRMQKRALDLAVAIPLIITFLPIFAIAACLVKLESRGPVLFKQDRVGRGNRLFKVLKFRSMRHEMLDGSGAVSAARDDRRVTRVGRVLRATSIDELPQLFNVLLGDMSLVGPRPHALGSLAEDRLFWEVDERYWHRHQLKPGITGLAQVRGFRGATHKVSDLTDRLQSDMEYIEGWDIWRDVAILFNTLRVVIHRNAF